MGYSIIKEVVEILPQAISSSLPDFSGTKINLVNVVTAPGNSNPTSVNRIPDTTILYYISLADITIDGILSQQYRTPLKKCARGEWSVDSDISEYNQTIETSLTHNLVEGDEILIRDDNSGIEELHTVKTIIDGNSFLTTDIIATNFSGNDIRVVRIGYPAPISQISARYAASFIYDKYFAAQTDPNVSEYGDKMRSIAMGQLNDILNGKIILDCQIRIGDRFGNPWIDSSYSHRKPIDGYNTSDRDMSKDR
jgi:hypothetical protein